MARAAGDRDAVIAQMEEAARQALEELQSLDQDAVVLVAQWWQKWYLKAGHKRLGRTLLNFAPRRRS